MTEGSARFSPQVVTVDPLADERWDRFVRAQAGASVYHLGAWAGILKTTYRFQPRYLALADSGGEFRAVMPVMYKRGPMSGARLRSLPVVPFAGPLGETAGLEREVMRVACEMVVRRGTQLVVTTSSESLVGMAGVACRPGLPRWLVPLDGSVDPRRWREGGRNPARGVRKAIAAGIKVREARTASDLKAFYRLYLRAQRRLRALPRRRLQLELARRALAGEGAFRLFLAEYEGTPVAGTVWHGFGGLFEGLYYGEDELYRRLGTSHAMYAHILDWALEHGYRELDLGGAAPGSSLAYFKSQWGASPVPLYFYVYPADTAPAEEDRPPAPSSVEIAEQRLLSAVWSVAPLDAIRAAGAVAYRYL